MTSLQESTRRQRRGTSTAGAGRPEHDQDRSQGLKQKREDCSHRGVKGIDER